MFSLGTFSSTQAQFALPITSDITLEVGQSNVENTGSAMSIFTYTGGTAWHWHAAVWDGTTPGLVLNEVNTATIIGTALLGLNYPSGGSYLTVIDPDVVIDRYEYTANRLLVVYQARFGGYDRVFYEIYKFNLSGLFLDHGPALVDPAFVIPNSETHPNVSINQHGQAVVVYQKRNDIWAAAIDLASGSNTWSLPLNVTNQTNGNYEQPDVSNFGWQFSTAEDVHMATIVKNTTGQAWIEHWQFDYSDINSLIPPAGPTFQSTTLTSPNYFESPRISAHWYDENEYFLGYIERYLGSPNPNLSEVKLVVTNVPLFSNPQNHFPIDLTSEANTQVSVSYNGDMALMCWTYVDTSTVSGQQLRGVEDVICHTYYWDGTIGPGSAAEYSVVADGGNGNTNISSLDGVTGVGGFVWFEEAVNEIRAKYSSAQLPNFRKAPEPPLEFVISQEKKAHLKVYPNPFEDRFSLDLQPGNYSMRIVNMQGVTIYSQQMQVSALQSFELDLSNFAAGIYLLQLDIEHANPQTLRLFKK